MIVWVASSSCSVFADNTRIAAEPPHPRRVTQHQLALTARMFISSVEHLAHERRHPSS